MFLNVQELKKYFTKFEFWIVVFFLVRLIGITNPPLETGHNWRQTTGLMVARNFLEVDADIRFPMTDETKGKTGIVGMEFPSLNYLYYSVAKIFGFDHWYGRLINLFVSSLGIYFYGRLLLRYFSRNVVLYTVIILSTSAWFTFSRKMMPDTYCVALIFIGLYFAQRFLDTGKWVNLTGFVLLSTLGVMSKIPAGIYLSLAFPLLLYSSSWRKMILLISVAVPVVGSCYWYFVWCPKLSIEFENWYNLGVTFSDGSKEIFNNLASVLERFYFSSFYSFIFFFCFFCGCFYLFKKANRSVLIVAASVAVVFGVYILKSGHYFYVHNYYIIPIVPVMALITGVFLASFSKKWMVYLLVLFGSGEAILNQSSDFFIRATEWYKMDITEAVALHVEPNELIVVNGQYNSLLLYLSHRKGWVCGHDQINDLNYLKDRFNEGCKFAVIDKHTCLMSDSLTSVFCDKNFKIIDLKELFD